jgi:uncharacterized Zn finger protein
MEDLKCPACGSEDVKDVSIRDNNGVLGPGYFSWVIAELYSCNKCQQVFRPNKKKK